MNINVAVSYDREKAALVKALFLYCDKEVVDLCQNRTFSLAVIIDIQNFDDNIWALFLLFPGALIDDKLFGLPDACPSPAQPIGSKVGY